MKKKQLILFVVAVLFACLSFAEAGTLVVKGKVTAREEVWNRRSNPLMGRPDVLEQIVLEVRVKKRIKGKLSRRTRQITVAITEHKALIKSKGLRPGDEGIFRLTGKKSPYELLDFELSFKAPPPPTPTMRPRPTSTPVPFPLNVSGRKIKDSEQLQKKALRKLVHKWKMEEAEVITLISHRGPRPPKGGYVYWGVKGKIDGQWHVWQAWTNNNRPFRGTRLKDPKRYQK